MLGMRLLASHPGVAQLSCEDCERFLVDVPVTGAFAVDRVRKEPIPRPPGIPTPCKSCPKCEGLPAAKCTSQAGKQATLSAKNWQTLQLYFVVQGSAGAGLTMDAITRKNLGLIEAEMLRVRK